jgi:hypothetical protein
MRSPQTMIHERVDIKRWKAEFPLARLREEARRSVLGWRAEYPERYPNDEEVERHIRLAEPEGEIIVGPRCIAVVEQLCEEAFGTHLGAGQQPAFPGLEDMAPSLDALIAAAFPDRVLTDVIVWATGEPPRREVTKIGGLPYRPASEEWPQSPEGKPLTFVGQVCFADSRDIVGQTPGDVLLIFADAQRLWGYGEDQTTALRFEWYDLGLTDLVKPGAVPETDWPLALYYGCLHRTYDYPGTENLFRRYGAWWCIGVIEGTKMGGVPRWIHGEEDLPGRFLCTLGSISYRSDQPYPFLNEPEPRPWKIGGDDADLMWDDMGCLYLFLDEDGDINWVEQGY